MDLLKNQQKEKSKSKSPTPQTVSDEKRRSSALRQLEGLQVGKKREKHEFQGIQLKRVPKTKKEEKKDEMERPDLKKLEKGIEKRVSVPEEETDLIKRDSLHPEWNARESTELEEYQKRANMRVFFK
jgi:hypothetical protein